MWEIIKKTHWNVFLCCILTPQRWQLFNALFIIVLQPQTPVKCLCELGTHSIWFYGSRSFCATGSGMLNEMSVCLMNRVLTQVSPRAMPFPLFFYCLFIPMRLCATITALFWLRMQTRWPRRPVWFPVTLKPKTKQKKHTNTNKKDDVTELTDWFDSHHLRRNNKQKSKEIFSAAKKNTWPHQCLAGF